MASRLLFGRAVIVILVTTLGYGCSSVSSDSLSVALDCNGSYTRCASKVSSVKVKPLNVIQAANSDAQNVVTVPSKSPEIQPTVKPVFFGFDEVIALGLDLSEVVVFLNKYPNATLTLHGYTDPIGSDDYNMTLSYKRADYIRELLLISGVSKQQLFVEPHGEKNLLVAVTNVQLGSKESLINMYSPNRRVEFEFKVSISVTQSN